MMLDGIFYFVQSERNYLSGENAEQIRNYFNDDNCAQKYYQDAYKFTKKVLNEYNLQGLTSNMAGDYEDAEQANYTIFGNSSNIENYNSGFNQERRAVIKYTIEKNLSSAIANFNNITTASDSINFQMPKLKDDEWDKVINNVSVITFLQGLNMGNSSYNGYAIVPNNKNEESVGEESIYIAVGDEYHRVNETDLDNAANLDNAIGVFNMNFERKSVDEFGADGSTVRKNYFYPRNEMASYNSIISQSGVDSLVDADGIPISIYEYLKDDSKKQLASIYYTALGRERYGLVKYGLK